MSVDCSRKEYLYLVYTKLYSEQLVNVLGIKITNIVLERKFGNRKVDICGYDEKGRMCMIEVQLSQSNDVHLKQVQELICTSSEANTLIVWIATKFRKQDLMYIKENIAHSSNKNIEFIALSLNEDIIRAMEEINKEDTLNQVELLDRLNSIKKHYTLIEGIKVYDTNAILNTKVIDDKTNYSFKQQFLLDILRELRLDCKFFANIYQYKEVNNNYFTLGSGYGDIDFRVTYNRKGLVGIEVVFSQVMSKKVFYKMLDKKHRVEDDLDYIVTLWDNTYHKVGTYINPLSYRDRENTVKMISRIVKKYICVFSKYLKETIEESKNVI